MTREHAYKLRQMLHKASASLADDDALEAIELFPVWQTSTNYAAGDRVRYGGVLYRRLQGHEAQDTWTPADAPSLWARVLSPDPGQIPEWEQPDSTNPYMKGDRVRFAGKIYESLVDNNVWSPADYPTGWKIVE